MLAKGVKLGRGAVPWATSVVIVAAVGATSSAVASAACVYERAAILNGQFWRAWTAHAVHFGPGHLSWNLAVFLPAGVWLERKFPVRARWFLAVAPAAISLVLLITEPALERYGGLSGVATGLLVLLALGERRERARDTAVWNAVLVLVLAKIAAEAVWQRSLWVRFEDPGIRSVPMAHVAGAAIGAISYAVAARKR